MIPYKNILSKSLQCLLFAVATLLVACNTKEKDVKNIEEDLNAKKQLQGTWETEIEGDVMFTMKGDTLYYNDSISAPVAFYVLHDTLVIRNHKEVRYAIKRLNATQFRFVNADGDDIELVKSSQHQALSQGEHKGAISLNQNRKIKKDTIVFYKDHRYHAYTQVNPTSYKVYRTSTNDNGMTIESIYYDNFVYIALYDGQHKVYGANIKKQDFAKLVPQSYLEQAVLSEIKIQGASANGVRFVAIISIPDSYTNYRVNIDITPSGKRNLSV